MHEEPLSILVVVLILLALLRGVYDLMRAKTEPEFKESRDLVQSGGGCLLVLIVLGLLALLGSRL
jgi:hypothetical protein